MVIEQLAIVVTIVQVCFGIHCGTVDASDELPDAQAQSNWVPSS
jgi:hypothetical protein